MFGMTIQRRLMFGFALGPVALLLIGWVAYSNTQAMVDVRREREHTRAFLEKISDVLLQAVNMETGERGFLLSNNEAYLQPYREGKQALDADIREIRQMIANEPRLRDEVETVVDIFNQRTQQLEATIGARRTKGLEAAVQIVQTNQGKRTLDRAREVIRTIRSEQGVILAEQVKRTDILTSQTLNTILFGTIAAFLAVSIGGFLIARSITRPIASTVQSLATTATEILAGTSQQASSMREQSTAVAETVTTVDEVLQTASQAAERAKTVADSALHAADVGASGKQSVMNTLSVMEEVKEQTATIAETILSLSERAQTIGEIIAAVNEITERSNLLALNAAIEASRAGEHGRGFSVVASEIKSLADQSKKATAQVRQILGDIQKSTNTAVLVTEQGTKSVHQAIRAANESGETISSLVETMDAAARAATQIAASASQQATGMSQIHQAMSHINEASNQNLAATRQSEQAAQDLHTLGTRLKAMIVGG
ncbi:MAG TPA: methyl-accepting chemotaxis protein [Rhizomicrobium sp.]|jgi:methyl-accepting chemotaxis protein|nr:methyl-accepting chemotaxis protein [Rhizomicrobium sp.]